MFRFRFRFAGQIPEEKLRKLWKKNHWDDRPFPTVIAHKLTHKRYQEVDEKYSSDPDVNDTTIQEYGHPVDPRGNFGFTLHRQWFNGVETSIIYVDKTFPGNINEILEHELKHLHDADQVRWAKKRNRLKTTF